MYFDGAERRTMDYHHSLFMQRGIQNENWYVRRYLFGNTLGKWLQFIEMHPITPGIPWTVLSPHILLPSGCLHATIPSPLLLYQYRMDFSAAAPNPSVECDE